MKSSSSSYLSLRDRNILIRLPQLAGLTVLECLPLVDVAKILLLSREINVEWMPIFSDLCNRICAGDKDCRRRGIWCSSYLSSFSWIMTDCLINFYHDDNSPHALLNFEGCCEMEERDTAFHSSEVQSSFARALCSGLLTLSRASWLWENVNIIEQDVEVSSQDGSAQSIRKVLFGDEKFWSSKGANSDATTEWATFKLVDNCAVAAVDIWPYQAYFQKGRPTYAPQSVRVLVGNAPRSFQFVSEYFRLENHPRRQRVRLTPHHDIPVGSYVRIEFRGKWQVQREDGLWYISLRRLEIRGVPIPNCREFGNSLISAGDLVMGMKWILVYLALTMISYQPAKAPLKRRSKSSYSDVGSPSSSRFSPFRGGNSFDGPNQLDTMVTMNVQYTGQPKTVGISSRQKNKCGDASIKSLWILKVENLSVVLCESRFFPLFDKMIQSVILHNQMVTDCDEIGCEWTPCVQSNFWCHLTDDSFHQLISMQTNLEAHWEKEKQMLEIEKLARTDSLEPADERIISERLEELVHSTPASQRSLKFLHRILKLSDGLSETLCINPFRYITMEAEMARGEERGNTCEIISPFIANLYNEMDPAELNSAERILLLRYYVYNAFDHSSTLDRTMLNARLSNLRMDCSPPVAYELWSLTQWLPYTEDHSSLKRELAIHAIQAVQACQCWDKMTEIIYILSGDLNYPLLQALMEQFRTLYNHQADIQHFLWVARKFRPTEILSDLRLHLIRAGLISEAESSPELLDTLQYVQSSWGHPSSRWPTDRSSWVFTFLDSCTPLVELDNIYCSNEIDRPWLEYD